MNKGLRKPLFQLTILMIVVHSFKYEFCDGKDIKKPRAKANKFAFCRLIPGTLFQGKQANDHCSHPYTGVPGKSPRGGNQNISYLLPAKKEQKIFPSGNSPVSSASLKSKSLTR